MNVLIVDDEISISRFIGSFIEKLGHYAENAHNGKEALIKFSENKFDLVLLDIFLPDIKGYELIPQFKELRHDIGIVTMTGHNSRELELEVRRHGVIYYMIKPFEADSLRFILDHIVNRSGLKGSQGSSPQQVDEVSKRNKI